MRDVLATVIFFIIMAVVSCEPTNDGVFFGNMYQHAGKAGALVVKGFNQEMARP